VEQGAKKLDLEMNAIVYMGVSEASEMVQKS